MGEKCLNHTEDDGKGARYSGVMYLSPTAEIIALFADRDKALALMTSLLFLSKDADVRSVLTDLKSVLEDPLLLLAISI